MRTASRIAEESIVGTNAQFDCKQLRAAGIVGGTVESVLVDQYGFLVLVVQPKATPGKRVLITITCDHEGNGPGAAMPEEVDCPADAHIEADAEGVLTIVSNTK